MERWIGGRLADETEGFFTPDSEHASRPLHREDAVPMAKRRRGGDGQSSASASGLGFRPQRRFGSSPLALAVISFSFLPCIEDNA